MLARTHEQLSVVRQALARAGIPHRTAPGPGAAPAESGSETGADAVELATFHRAKGLEWTSVCVVGLEDGFVPIVYAESDTARAEERRLLYVALTRASRDLHCSWSRTRAMGRGRPWSDSRRRGWRRWHGCRGPAWAGRHHAMPAAASPRSGPDSGN